MEASLNGSHGHLALLVVRGVLLGDDVTVQIHFQNMAVNIVQVDLLKQRHVKSTHVL